MSADSGGPKWLTVDEAARHARCGVKTIRKMIARGELLHVPIDCRGGQRPLTTAAWVDEALLARAARKANPAAPPATTLRVVKERAS